MESPLNLVIVGCGMAAGKLIEEIVHRAPSRYRIVVMGNEPEGNYDRIRLTAVLKGTPPDNFAIHPPKWFVENGVTAYLGETAVGVDLDQKQVTSDRGTVLSYDKLVFATGAAALVPPIDGLNSPGVFVLRNLADVRAIGAFIEDKHHITVMGGGILGLELADTLTEMGKTVSVNHLMPDLMEQQLSQAPAAVLEKRFEQAGMGITKENPITAVTRCETGLCLQLQNGQSEQTDALIINCGIVPNTALAAAAGLPVRRGILVDDKLNAHRPDIYAVGECAEFEGTTVGLLAPVYAQAKTLAAILSGVEDGCYRPAPAPSVKLKSRIPAMAVGIREPAAGDTIIEYNNPASLIYKRLIVRDNLLVGAVLIGDDLNADVIAGYAASKIPLPKKIESLLFPGVKNAAEITQAVYWPGDVTVCDCNGITCGTIRDAYRQAGRDVQRISKLTRAATSCGTCLSRVAAIVENTYDAVVVGAGLGGLTAAANLARHGLRVLIIEQHDKPGGYASSFSREGFTFDVSLHNMGPMNSSILKIFENLGLRSEVEYVPYENFQRVVFPHHNFVLPKGIDNFEAYLVSTWPEETAGIRSLFSAMKHVRKGFEEIEDLTLDADNDEMLSPLMAAKYPEFSEWVLTTFGELLDKHVKSVELKAVISNIWWYLGLPPSEMPALLYSVVGLGYMEYAGGYIKGTAQALSNALVSQITRRGGKLLLNTKVTRILVSEEKVDGVITDQGEMFYTDLVLSNVGGFLTFGDLVDENVVKKKYRNKIHRQENAVSAVQLYLGLDCPKETLNLTEHSFSAFTSYDHDENLNFILNGAYDKTFFSCMVYSALDENLAPEGKCVVNIFSLDHMKNWEGLSDLAYEKKKAQVTETILRKVEKFIPGLSTHIVVKELGTPKTMHRYTGHKEGAIFGPSQNIYQSGLNRLQAETPIGGLYLVGAAIYPGGGYPSVINSGYRTAHAILRKMGRV